MNEKNLAALEAILFIHGEPLTFKKIETILGLQSQEIHELVAEFDRRLKEEGRGLTLILDEPIEKIFEEKNWESKRIQLVTKPALGSLFENFIKEELRGELSPASLEVLSIVSYLAPISRARIEYIRGVNSTFTLRSLLIRGLIERYVNPEHAGVYLYRPSLEFLKHIGLASRQELPEYEKFQKLLTLEVGSKESPENSES